MNNINKKRKCERDSSSPIIEIVMKREKVHVIRFIPMQSTRNQMRHYHRHKAKKMHSVRARSSFDFRKDRIIIHLLKMSESEMRSNNAIIK